MKIFFSLLVIISFPAILFAQKEKEGLGNKDYVIVSAINPVLGESLKLSDSPLGDTSTATPPVMDYSIRSRKLSSEYEASTIKAVKIKDEQLAKLYRTYLRLGIGNYTTYYGDLYVNALRSKKGALGFSLNHLSGNPGLKEAGPAGFSQSHGGVYGKYFFDHSVFSGDVNYNRDVVHYYGYDSADTIIEKDDLKQRFNRFGMKLSFGSNYLTKDHLDYSATFGFSSLNDLYDVSEGDFLIAGKVGKQVDDKYLNADISFNYFKKSLAKGESLSLLNELNRSIVTFVPTLTLNKDKVNLVIGLNLSVEKNLDSDVHLFPKIDVTLPIAEHILYAFAGVNGNVIKNNYHTITNENPFVTSEIIPFNSVNKIELKGGLSGNFSSMISFVALVKYSTIDSMLLYYNDTKYFNKFNALYENGKVLNLHAELSYKPSPKFNATFKFDQYGYTIENGEKAWHKPNTEFALNLNYNFWDKLILNAAVFASGKYDVRITDSLGFTSEKVNGYMDANLGIEYRYSKIFSLFVNLNNLGFARYERWYNYPSERFNVLGGISYSF